MSVDECSPASPEVDAEAMPTKRKPSRLESVIQMLQQTAQTQPPLAERSPSFTQQSPTRNESFDFEQKITKDHNMNLVLDERLMPSATYAELLQHQAMMNLYSQQQGLLTTVQNNIRMQQALAVERSNADYMAKLLASAIQSRGRSQEERKTLEPDFSSVYANRNSVALKYGATPGPNRMSYPREFKLMVVRYYYDNGQNKYRTCKEFQITKSMLNGWLQKLDKIQESRPGSLKSGRSGRKPQFPDIERQLFDKYQDALANGQKVSNRWLRDNAKALAASQSTSDSPVTLADDVCQDAGLPVGAGATCQFSERWLSNFKRRYSINLVRDWSNSDSSDELDQSLLSAMSAEADTTTTSSSSPHSREGGPLTIDSDGDEPEKPEHASPTPAIIPSSRPQPTENAVSVPLSRPLTITLPAPCTVSSPHVAMPFGGEPGKRGRKVQFPQVERVLYETMQRRQTEGVKISNRWLQNEARKLAIQMCPEVFVDAMKSARCMFSEHWLHNFKKRYNVSLKHNNAASTVIRCTSPPLEKQSTAVNQPVAQTPPAALASAINMASLLNMRSAAAFPFVRGLSDSLAAGAYGLSQIHPLNLAEWYCRLRAAGGDLAANRDVDPVSARLEAASCK